MEIKNKYLVLKKISDDRFNGNHPNGVNVGSTIIQGYPKLGINVGEQLFLFPSLKFTSSPQAWTSVVKSFDKKNMILKTANSTYKIQELNEKDLAH